MKDLFIQAAELIGKNVEFTQHFNEANSIQFKGKIVGLRIPKYNSTNRITIIVENDNYFDVCKVILKDLIETKSHIAENYMTSNHSEFIYIKD